MSGLRHRFNQSVSLLGLFVAVWVTASMSLIGLGFFGLRVLEWTGHKELITASVDAAYLVFGEVGVWVIELWHGGPLDLQYNILAGFAALAIGVVVWMLPVSVGITAWLVRREKRRLRGMVEASNG